MSNEITSDGKGTNDEKSSGSGKLELMSKEELIKLVKNQVILKKKLEIKITELTNSNTSLTETEDVRNSMIIFIISFVFSNGVNKSMMNNQNILNYYTNLMNKNLLNSNLKKNLM
jgi:hypothetical protein